MTPRPTSTCLATVPLLVLLATLTLPGSVRPAAAEPDAATPDAPLTAREIMDRVDHINDAADETNTLEMTLTNKRGQTRERTLQGWSQQTEGDNQNQLVRFLEPKDVKDVGLLTWEHDDRDDDQWLFLPALKKTRRISSADQADSFMGTDFSYEDMRSEKLDEHAYELLREEEVDGRACWVIQATPTSENQMATSGYSRRITWVDRQTYVPLKGEFYDKKGALLKELVATELQEVVPGLWRANRLQMTNVQKEHNTVLVFTGREVNTGLDDDLFTERELKRGH